MQLFKKYSLNTQCVPHFRDNCFPQEILHSQMIYQDKPERENVFLVYRWKESQLCGPCEGLRPICARRGNGVELSLTPQSF